jgi:predicted aldo/keto reductase-like oxidoreductase
MQRRDILWGVPAALAAIWLERKLARAEDAKAKGGPIPRRKLGRTGELVSCIGLGGAHAGKQKNPEESVRIIRSAIDAGINFLDNCWDYNEGQSEIRMGRALRGGYRDKVFLMSKIDGRTRAAAAKQIDESLKRLQTDRIDLMQVHEIIRMDDPEKVFGAGGTLEALTAAQKAGKVRYVGFTGHKSAAIHLHMLDVAAAHSFRFDTVQMPLNVMDAHDEGFERKVLPRLVKEEIGVLGMKPIGSGKILESKTVSAIDCLNYALSLPTSVIITGCDSIPILEQALKVARSHKPLSQAERSALLARTSKTATADYELYKSSTYFDGTTAHPEWLG